MLVMLAGMVTLVRPQPANAQSPMPVTILPPMEDGMTSAPPDPVYPVMVINPLVMM